MTVAEACAVGEFIADELEARGWSAHDLAKAMGGDVAINECTLDLLAAHDDPQIKLGQETADGLARAFGTDAMTWIRLDKAWREWATKQLPAEQSATNPPRMIGDMTS